MGLKNDSRPRNWHLSGFSLDESGVIAKKIAFHPRNLGLSAESLDERGFRGRVMEFHPKNRGWNAEFLDEGALGRVIYGTRPKKWA